MCVAEVFSYSLPNICHKLTSDDAFFSDDELLASQCSSSRSSVEELGAVAKWRNKRDLYTSYDQTLKVCENGTGICCFLCTHEPLLRNPQQRCRCAMPYLLIFAFILSEDLDKFLQTQQFTPNENL